MTEKEIRDSMFRKLDEVGIKGLNKEERAYYDELMSLGLEVDWNEVDGSCEIIDILAEGFFSKKPNVDPMKRHRKGTLTKFNYTVIMEYLCFEMELVPEKYGILLEMYEDLYKRREECNIDGHLSLCEQLISSITPYNLKNIK